MSKITIFLIFVVFYKVINAANFATQCFLPTFHRGISNASPIAELWNVGPFDCLMYCIVNAGKTGDGCASVVYHRRFSTCQLYGHDGTFDGAKIVFATGHDYYNRTSYEGICQDRHTPSRGYAQRQKHPKVHGVKLQNGIALNSSSQKVSTPFNYPKAYYLYANEPKGECSRRQKLGYFVLKDFELTRTAPVAKVNGIDRFACLNYCAQNINAHGDFSRCVLISYDARTEECQLHDESAKEAALFTRIEPKEYTLVAEKFCFDKSLRCPAETHLRVIAGQEINDRPLHTFTHFETLNECTNACFEHPYCKAVVMQANTCTLYPTILSSNLELLRPASGRNTVVVDCKC
uniref:Apple domain-containing protein n=1 Tax=Panagrolaimus superbus TaxID=310955 RepID=A0A914ZAR0_9BILA